MRFRLLSVLIIALLIFSTQSQAQIVVPDSTLAKPFIPKKISYGFQAGTLFGTTFGHGSAFSTYLSPHLTYSLNSRFSINAGISIITTSIANLQPYYSSPSEISYNGNQTSAILYIKGNYRLNDRLILGGTAYKEFDIFNNPKGTYPYSNQPAQGVYLNADYKITEHFHIQAGFGYSKGRDPYNNSLFPGTQPFGGNYPFYRY